ncbi:MAG: bifunctional oligoribonuclease/PAP phosphatase NrnA [Chloroflexota bacterium]
MSVTTSLEWTQLSQAAALIRDADCLAVVSHVNPDADAVGSVLGLTLGIRALGKEVIPTLSDPVPEYARFLQGTDAIAAELPVGRMDAIICADAAGIDRVGRLYTDGPENFEGIAVLNLDHHRTNPLYGTVNYVDGAASSTSELVYRLLRELDAPIGKDAATALLFGIVGDTGSFRNGATTPGALATAAELLTLGADNQKIAFQLFECKTFAAARLWGLVVSGVELDESRHIVFAHLTQDMLRISGATVDEAEGTAEYLRGVEEAEVVMMLKETEENSVRVSMRSRPAVDVSAIATALGGGGHRQAAGCTIDGSRDNAKAVLIATFDALKLR